MKQLFLLEALEERLGLALGGLEQAVAQAGPGLDTRARDDLQVRTAHYSVLYILIRISSFLHSFSLRKFVLSSSPQDNFHGWKVSIEMLVRLQQALLTGGSSQQAKVPGQAIDLVTVARQAFSEAVAVVGERGFPHLQLTAVEVVEKAKTKTTETVPLIYPRHHVW